MAAPSSCLVMQASPGYLLSSFFFFFELNNTNNSFQGLSRHQLFVIPERAAGIVLPSWKEADRPTPLRHIALFTLSGKPGLSQQPHQNRSSPAWSGVSSGGLNQSHFIFSVVHSVIKPVMKLLGAGATEPRCPCHREAPASLKKCLPSSFTLYEKAWAESRPR